MKKYGFSVLNSLLAGILICGLLAACGIAEKNFAAPKPLIAADTVGADVPTHLSDKKAAPEESAVAVIDDKAEKTAEEANLEPEENTVANAVIETARDNLGVKYASNKCTPEDGFDSSGFVYYCFKQSGIDIPRRVKDQIKFGTEVGYDDLIPGDIAFFSAEEGGKANFCGLYAGGGLIIYSPAPGGAVKTANITTSYWTARFVSGARII